MAVPGQWLLGIDGGGSTTRALLQSADGQIMGPWQGPGSNPFDHPQWQQTLTDLVRSLPVGPQDLRAYCAGLAGHGDLPEISEAQRHLIGALLPQVPGLIVNDAQIAHDGAFRGRAGVLLLAGTGSAAWASDGRGHHWRLGGQGEAYGDEGSAHWIGRQALSLLVRAVEGRRPDPDFAAALLPKLGLERPSAKAVLEWTHATDHLRSRTASVARWVDALAQEGQATAAALMDQAGHLLAELVRAAWHARILPLERRWSSAGSVTGSARVHAVLLQMLGEDTYCPAPQTPLQGAVWRAREVAEGRQAQRSNAQRAERSHHPGPQEPW